LLDAVALIGQLAPLAEDVGLSTNGETHDVLSLLHRELLASLNGFTVQQGTLRMFGTGRGDALDLGWWNDKETWRFAWDDRVDSYVIFGATAWGDQYAYRRSEGGDLDSTVYLLEGTLLRAEPLAESFAEFAETELLRVATKPYDSATIGALDRYGPIKPSDQWTYAPSIALGGEESLDNVVRLPAQVAMTFAGDIASALRSSTPGSWPTGVQPYQDDRGRQRLRVQFDR
jgi:hypothetical protein